MLPDRIFKESFIEVNKTNRCEYLKIFY